MKYVLLHIFTLAFFNSFGQKPFRPDELKIWADLAKEFKEAKHPFSFCEINSEFGAIADTVYRGGGKAYFLNTIIIEDSANAIDNYEGQVIGPFRSSIDGSSHYIDFIFRILKIDSSYITRASHILVRDQDSEDRTKDNILADKIIARIKSGSTTFEKMAMKYGSDGTAKNGGDLGWFAENQMIKPFSDACMNAKKGEIFKLETIFGIHVVMVTEEKIKIPESYTVLPIIKKLPNTK